MRKAVFLKFVIFIAVIGLFVFPVIAQNEKTIGVDRDGEFHFDSKTKVGGKMISSGMYRISQVFVNGEHFIVIRKVPMVSSGKGMGVQKPGDEVARVKCTIWQVEDQNKKSKILVRRNAANERIALEVWFRGEKAKHILPT
ncbi:MAG: hypothetical protein IPM59_03715 [Chloracidobacterium sp.]|nr:hypothetical protein [Chloracidobacterium sp.]